MHDFLNIFDDLDRQISAVIEGHFSIPVRIIPHIGARYNAATIDPGRPVVEVMAVYSSGPAQDGIGGQVRAGASGGGTRIAGQSVTLWLSPAAVEAIPYYLQVEDRIEMIGRDPPNRFKVSSFRPTDTGDLELALTEDEA